MNLQRFMHTKSRQVVDLNIGRLRTACLATHLGGKNLHFVANTDLQPYDFINFFSTLKSLDGYPQHDAEVDEQAGPQDFMISPIKHKSRYRHQQLLDENLSVEFS